MNPQRAPTAVDVAFDLQGTALPAEHAWPLVVALGSRLPWLAHDPHAGVHPVRASPTVGGEVLLAARAKLTLRVPEPRVEDALQLSGLELDVGGHRLKVGAGKARTLVASGTIAAQRVASASGDPGVFELVVAGVLARMGIQARVIAGGRRRGMAGCRCIEGFALCVHGLRADDSLRLQYEGLGEGRTAGWGIFVPAKAIVSNADA